MRDKKRNKQDISIWISIGPINHVTFQPNDNYSGRDDQSRNIVITETQLTIMTSISMEHIFNR